MTEEKKEPVEKAEDGAPYVEEEVEEKVEPKKVADEEPRVENVEEDDFSIFVSDSDTFDIEIKCYRDNDELKVEGVDTEYDVDKKAKAIKVTFKRPSQGDLTLINTQAGRWTSSQIVDSDETYKNLMSLEFARIIVLIREWNLSEALTVDVLATLDPKIVKSMIYKVREKISMDGII